MARCTIPRGGSEIPDPFRRLASAVILQAMLDAKNGDLASRRWLKTEGRTWLDCMGIELTKLDITRGLKSRHIEQCSRFTTSRREKARQRAAGAARAAL